MKKISLWTRSFLKTVPHSKSSSCCRTSQSQKCWQEDWHQHKRCVCGLVLVELSNGYIRTYSTFWINITVVWRLPPSRNTNGSLLKGFLLESRDAEGSLQFCWVTHLSEVKGLRVYYNPSLQLVHKVKCPASISKTSAVVFFCQRLHHSLAIGKWKHF